MTGTARMALMPAAQLGHTCRSQFTELLVESLGRCHGAGDHLVVLEGLSTSVVEVDRDQLQERRILLGEGCRITSPDHVRADCPAGKGLACSLAQLTPDSIRGDRQSGVEGKRGSGGGELGGGR